MEFAQPFGFWLGLAAAGVLSAHLVRRRARRHEVPFLPLWAAVLAGRRGGFGSALVRWLDLACVLVACGLVAAAAGGPFLPGTPDRVRDLVLVLDGGVELRAGERADMLRKVASAEIRRRAPGTRMVLIGVRDDGPSIWTGEDRIEALRFVAGHRPGWLAAKEKEALELAVEASRDLRAADRVLCTPRPLEPTGFRVRRFGDDVKNAGIDALEVLADPDGRGPIARLNLIGEGWVEIGDRWSGKVEGSRRVDLPLPPGGRVTLTARLEGDRFEPDDSVHLILPRRKVPRVLVVTRKEPSPFLAAALQALEATGVIRGPLGRTTPDHAAAAGRTYDLLIFDRCSPGEPVTGTRALYLAPPPGALPFKLGELTPAPAILDAAREHPVLTGFDLERIPPRETRAIHGGEALAYAGRGPVLATGPSWIALGFDPDRSVFAASPAYPLFLRNCVAVLCKVLPQAKPEFFGVGERAPAEGVAEVEGRGPVRVQDRLIGPPGFWKLEDRTLAVGLLQPDVDLRGPGRASDPLAEVGEPAVPDRPLTAQFAAAAIVLLLVAWWVFWRT